MILACHSHVAELICFTTDTSNFQNSTLWDSDATSGVGSWGDPNDDYQITDGGFAGFPLSYPTPHKLRRMYTPSAPDHPELFVDSFTPESQVAMVNGHVGDFISFQAVFERGSHGAIHRIVGGCVNSPITSCFRPLTEPTQRSSRGMPIKRSC